MAVGIDEMKIQFSTAMAIYQCNVERPTYEARKTCVQNCLSSRTV